MKTVAAVVLFGLFLLLLLVQWKAQGPAVARASAGSQIYIHGTPVCVFQDRGEVLARVGRCEAMEGPAEEPDGRVPFHGFGGGRGLNLPPGHPPVGDGIAPDGPAKRTLI